jgi:hypothetical protein
VQFHWLHSISAIDDGQSMETYARVLKKEN